MKKYLSLFLVLATAFLQSSMIAKADVTLDAAADVSTESGAQVEAQDNAKLDIDNERMEVQAKIDALKADIQTEKDAAKAKIESLRITVRENAFQRFDAAFLRINNLNDRLIVQIAKLSGKGVDVSGAQSFEVTAEANLADAKTKIATVDSTFSASLNQLTADQKTAIKTLAKDIQTSLNKAHTAINNAIKSLREALTNFKK